ncbi:MAG: hypothetical protein PHQ62_02000 [Clostridia bacterium]|nr:hypothetical protein [Clostridia bacterium]
MRFIKIFLACFFSLVGVVSGALGIMYVAGSFNRDIVEPTNIYFEKNNYYVDGDFTIKILSTTENVTQTSVTLSLENQIGSIVDGKITDGKITIPKTVYLNRSFTVQVIKAFNEELDKDWIVGGISNIIASSESDRVIDINTNVFIDVPVDSISVTTYSNPESQIPSTTFALGESFYAEAVFLPKNSIYKYSTNETKKIFFDISANTNGSIAENQEMITAMQQAGKPYVYGFDVLKVVSEVDVKAYCFNSAVVEDDYANQPNITENDLISAILSATNGIQNSQVLTFTNRTVSVFSISDTAFTLKTNTINKIVAYSTSSTVANFGIVINGSDNSLLQNKIADVGVRAYIMEGGQARPATDSELIFVNYTKFGFAPNASNKGAFYQNETTGQFLPVESEETYNTTYDKYYFPKMVAYNANNSYWNVVPITSNLEIFFEAYLFENNDTINIEERALSTASPYASTLATATALNWVNETDVNLIFVDSNIGTEQIIAEYSLKNNIYLSNPNATYTTIKFLAYSADYEIATFIQNIRGTTYYDLSGYGITASLFEITGDILTAYKDGVANIVAVVIKTDYLGQPIITDGKYEICSISTSSVGLEDYKNLVVDVSKTIQNLTAEIEVSDLNSLKNTSTAIENVLDKIAFVQNQSESVFKVNLKITANENTTIEKEIELFENAWNNGKIYLKAYKNNLESLAISFDNNYTIKSQDEDSYTISFNAYTTICETDTQLTIKLFYEKTDDLTSSEYISKVIFSGDLEEFTYDPSYNAIIEVFDGKAYSVEFGIATTETDYLEKSYIIEKGEEFDDGDITKYYASNVSAIYKNLQDENVTESVLNEDNTYKIKFFDKYGNQIVLSATDYSLTTNQNNVVITINNYSSSASILNPPNATLFVASQSNAGTIESSNYNAGISEGTFSDDFQSFSANSNDIINITRYGAKESVINLSGRNGLLNIEFKDANDDIFELCNIIKYKIYTTDWKNVYENWQTTYNGVLTLSENGSYITINKSIDNEIKINLLATTGLGINILIELSIKQNIVATYSISTATEQSGASSITLANEYKGIFSDNNVDIAVTYTLKLYENFSMTCPSDENGNTFNFKDSGKTLAFTNTLLANATITVNFDVGSLGQKSFLVKSGNTDFDFKQPIYLNINANLKLKNAVDNTLYLPIEVSALNADNQLLSSEELERIIADIEIDTSKVSLVFGKVDIDNVEYNNIYSFNTNGNLVLNTEDIFEIYGFNLRAISSLTSTYKVTLDVKYGNAKIGSIVVTVSANMGADETAENFDYYFENYNGKLHLVLLSETNYTYQDLKLLFKNTDSISFETPANNLVYKLTNILTNKIEVQSLNTYTSKYCLHLVNSIGNIIFPVLFSPLPIGYVQYSVGNAQDQTKTQEINNDIAKLNDRTTIIQNQIFDKYDSGKHTSLLQTNYTISLTGTTYTFKNYTNEILYILAHIDSGYYYKQIASISSSNTNYVFDLTTVPSGWVQITNASTIADDYLTAETTFIGAFSSITQFSEATNITQESGYGLSLYIYNQKQQADKYVINIFDEVNGEISTTASTYATFDSVCFLLKPQIDFSAVDRVVWVVVKDNLITIAKYRVKIEKNSSLNIYYPYDNDLGESSVIGVSSEQAEYVYFSGNNNYIIDFNSSLAVQYPNSVNNNPTKRVMLQKGSELAGWQTSTNASIIFTPYMVSIGNIYNYDTNTFYNHFTFNNNVLTIINNTTQTYVIYLKAKAQINGQDIGEEVIYKIIVNYDYTSNNFHLKQMVGEEYFDYNQSSEIIDCGEVYDFSDKMLYKGITQQEGLKYHIYSTEGKNLADYVTLDLTEKTLCIKQDIKLVSDLKVNFVYYTIFGVVLNTEITFASSMQPVFNDSQTTVQKTDNIYSVFADVPFNLTSIFAIEDNGSTVIATAEYWKYSLDNGLTYVDGDSLIFAQNQIDNYVVKVIVRMSDIDNENYIENYNFEFKLQVKQSLKSNYTNSDNAYNISPSGIVFSKTDYEVNNSVFVVDMITSIGYLYSTQSIDIINQYNLTASVHSGTGLVSLTYDLSTNKFTLKFDTCPTESTKIVINFKLTKGITLDAFITFYLIPDVVPEANYPKADTESSANYTFEAYYLDKEYINHSTQNNVWNNVGNDYEIISLSGLSIFKENRIKMFDNNGNEIVDTNKLNEIAGRIKIVVSSINVTLGNLVIAYIKGENTYLNNEINLESAVGFNDYLFVKWVGSSAVSQNQTGEITFAIYVDNTFRTNYTIKFYSNIQHIFSTQIDTFYDTKIFDTDTAEIFYVLPENTENLFSNQTAKLHMTFKSNALSSTPTVLTAYINQKAENNKVGQITVNNSTTTIDWILKGSSAISLANLIISIGENDYLFNNPTTNNNSIYKTYLQQDGCFLTNRLTINYLGNPLSYNNYTTFFTAGTSTINGFNIYKGNPQAIDVKNTVNIKFDNNVFEITIGSYYYTLVYDFNKDQEKEFDSYAPQYTVGDSAIDLFETYGITHYNGNQYTSDYFANTAVTINAQVILITNANFENSQTSANVVYYNAEKASYCNLIKAGLTSTKTTWIDYVSLVFDQVGSKTTRIYLTLNGAENNGNYVYVLITYKANDVSADEAYAIVKLKISPNWEHSFLSDLSSTNLNQETGNPLIVNYSSLNTISNITLININNSPNYISLFRSGTSENLALSGAFNTFTLVGEIADYLQLEKTSTSLTLKQGTNIANYGNKTGYILIADKYGYQQKYYIELGAQSSNPLSITPQIINSVNNESIYESSTISIVDNAYDVEVSGAISTNYAFKIANLNNLVASGYTYKVTYIISGLGLTSANHNAGDPSTYNTGYIPAQNSSLYNNNSLQLSLQVLLEITNGSVTEFVTLTRTFNLLKRFETSGVQNAVVRDGQNFNVADYINMVDNNIEESLGEIMLSGKIYTLVVDESFVGITLTLNVFSGGQNYANVNIVVGKNHNNVTMTATNGKYYYPLNLFSELSSIANFEDYTFGAYGQGVPSTLPNPTDTVPTGQSVYLIKDKCLSIVTSNNNPTEQITSALNNGPYKVLIPFALNFDGKQNKSIYEAITNLQNPDYPISTLLNNIQGYELDRTKISTADLQLLKGIKLYNDTLVLKIDEGMINKYYNVIVYYDGTNYKETSSRIIYNYAHFVYISISSILGNELGLNEEGVYKIEVVYAIGNIPSGTQNLYLSKIDIDGFDLTPEVTVNSNSYIYTLTINIFRIQELEINVESQMFEDKISVLTAQDFVNRIKTSVNKYYLVKYIKDDVVYSVSVSYSVTPKYYTIDNNGDIGGAGKKIVYANQYTLLYNSQYSYYYYEIDFNTWANAYNLLDKNGNVLTTVRDATEDLVFQIQSEEGSGAAILDANNKIVTTSSFTEQHTVKIAVYVKVFKDKVANIFDYVYIDTIEVSISKDTLYVPVAGNYNVIISATLSGRIYSINIQHQFTSTTETIAKLIATNTNLAPLVLNGQIGFATSGSTTYVSPSNCDFSVVNVINDIYNATYDGSKLNIKINLDETQNSIGKVISLQAVGRGIVNTNLTQESNIFQITVGYDTVNNQYNLTASIGTGEDIVYLSDTPFTKVSGYYNVALDLNGLRGIFENIFVGTDYSYSINIIEILNNDVLNIVYSNDTVEANLDDTLFFHIAYTDSSNNSSSKIVGLKYTQDNQNYSGNYGYALDVSILNLTNIVNYTVSFLGGFDLDCENNISYNLLIKVVEGNSINTKYSLAHILYYSDTSIFEVIDYANSMKLVPQNENNTISIYEEEPSGTTLTKIKISSTATSNKTYYYGVYIDSVSTMQMFGLATTGTDLYIDVTTFATAGIVVKNCNTVAVKLNGEILPLFESSSTATTYWKSTKNSTTILYTKTDITKTTFVKNEETITILTFDITPGLDGSSFTSSTLVTENTNIIDLTAISGTVESTYTYTFELSQNNISLGSVQINGDQLSAVNITDILTNLEVSFENGNYKFVYISFDDNIPD